MNEKDYQILQKILKDFDGTIVLYISGSQGVVPAEMTITFGVDAQCIEDIKKCFYEFIDENVVENLDSYLEDCDGDEEAAFGEAICDSGEFWIGTPQKYDQILLENL